MEGVSFKRNFGAALVGEYNKVPFIWYLSTEVIKSFKAEVSSISPSSEERATTQNLGFETDKADIWS